MCEVFSSNNHLPTGFSVSHRGKMVSLLRDYLSRFLVCTKTVLPGIRMRFADFSFHIKNYLQQVSLNFDCLFKYFFLVQNFRLIYTFLAKNQRLPSVLVRPTLPTVPLLEATSLPCKQPYDHSPSYLINVQHFHQTNKCIGKLSS